MIKRNRGVHERLRGNPGCSTGSEHVQCAVASLPSVSTHAALPIFRLVSMQTSKVPFHRRCLKRRGFVPFFRKWPVDTLLACFVP